MPVKQRRLWRRISRRIRAFPDCRRLSPRSTVSMPTKERLPARNCAGGRQTPKMDSVQLLLCFTWLATRPVQARPRKAVSYSANSLRNIRVIFSRRRRGRNFRRRKLSRAARGKRFRLRKQAEAFAIASCAVRLKPPLGNTRKRSQHFCKPLEHLSWRLRHSKTPPYARFSRASRKPKTKPCVAWPSVPILRQLSRGFASSKPCADPPSDRPAPRISFVK